MYWDHYCTNITDVYTPTWNFLRVSCGWVAEVCKLTRNSFKTISISHPWGIFLTVLTPLTFATGTWLLLFNDTRWYLCLTSLCGSKLVATGTFLFFVFCWRIGVSNLLSDGLILTIFLILGDNGDGPFVGSDTVLIALVTNCDDSEMCWSLDKPGTHNTNLCFRINLQCLCCQVNRAT